MTVIDPRPALMELAVGLRAPAQGTELTTGADALVAQTSDILEGFVLAAKRMGLSDVYGLLRANIAEDASEEAGKIRMALDMLAEAGVPTEEPELQQLLAETAA